MKELIEIINKYELIKEELKKAKVELYEQLNKVGLDNHFQDEEGTVYKVTVPTGTYVEFSPISYARTRRVGEKKGSLSLTDAKALGYKV